MKVIDLLNKISNGEKVPENIIFKGEEYVFCKDNYTYGDKFNNDRWLFDDLYNVIDILNEEIKILEDTTEEIEELHFMCDDSRYANVVIDMREKINELVRAVNKLNNTTYKAENGMTD